MVPISCNAIGDIIALIDIGVTVCKTIVAMKHAKTEYKQVLADLESLRPILQQLDRTLGDSKSEELIQLIIRAKCDIGEALHRLIKHDTLNTQGDNLPAHTRIRVGWDALRWALSGRKEVDDGMTKLSKTLGVLHLGLGVVHIGNSNAQSKRLEDGQSQLLTGIKDIRTETIHILQQNENIFQDVATAITVTRDSSADIRGEIATSSRILHGSLNEIVQQSLARDRRANDRERLEDMRRLDDRQWLEETLNAQLRAILHAPQHRHPSFVTEIWQAFPGRHRLVIAGTAAFARLNSNTDQFPSSELMSGCVGSLLTLAVSAPSGGERVGYVLCALSLLLVMGLTRMYKAPKATHVIIIIDFFGHGFELPLDDATSSTSLHAALEQHFENKRGFNLTRTHMYELALTDELPVTWDVPLKPGQKLLMNARVYDHRSGQCPACKTFCSPGCPRPDQWSTCTKCSARFDFKSPAAEDGADISPGLARELEPSESRATAAPAPISTSPQQAILEEIAYCHRIRVLVLDPTASVCVAAAATDAVPIAKQILNSAAHICAAAERIQKKREAMYTLVEKSDIYATQIDIAVAGCILDASLQRRLERLYSIFLKIEALVDSKAGVKNNALTRVWQNVVTKPNRAETLVIELEREMQLFQAPSSPVVSFSPAPSGKIYFTLCT